MRVNLPAKTMDMEARDVNYVLVAYIRSYLFASKNEDPVEIIFPMYSAVPHPTKPGVVIPIKWVSPEDHAAIDIAKDGSLIPEVTPIEEAKLDDKDKITAEVKAAIEKPIESPAKEVAKKLKDRVPKMPASGDIGPGTHPDDLGQRDIRLAHMHYLQIVHDLKDEPGVDESKEILVEIEKP